jgi:hypothetical protein
MSAPAIGETMQGAPPVRGGVPSNSAGALAGPTDR